MKNRMMKSIVVSLVLLALVFSFAGCGNAKPQQSESTAISTETATASAVDADQFKEKMTFKFAAVDGDKAGKDDEGNPSADYEWFTKKFNIEFQFINMSWGDFIDKPRLWIASGDVPDLMMMDIAPARYGEYLTQAKSKAFKAFPDLEKYPNMKEKMDGMATGKKFYVDGKLYAWPAYLDLQKYKNRQSNSILYRKDWAQAVNLYKEDEVYTLDEWANLVKNVISKDPGKNGKGKTIGMIGPDYCFPQFFGPGFYSPNMLQYTTDKDGKYVWGASLPETTKAIQLAKKWYDEGIIWKDQILVKPEDLKNKMAAGVAFAVAGQHFDVGIIDEYSNAILQANPKAEPENMLGLAQIKTPEGKVITYEAADQWSQTVMSPKLSDAEVDRICSAIDYLCTDEGYYLRTYGVPDKDFKLQGGELTVLWPKDKDGKYVVPSYGSASWVWMRLGGLTDGFSLSNPFYEEWKRNLVLHGLDLAMKPDAQVVKIDADLMYFDGPEYQKVGTKEKEIYQEIAKLMVSKGDITKEWNDWVKAQMKTIQPVVDEINEYMKK